MLLVVQNYPCLAAYLDPAAAEIVVGARAEVGDWFTVPVCHCPGVCPMGRGGMGVEEVVFLAGRTSR
jgi:hypothetical protein